MTNIPDVPRAPDAPRPPEVPTTQEHRFPCDTCGGDMRFDPGDDRLVCDHCGHLEPLTPRTDAIAEIAIARGLDAGTAPQEETRVADCPNCGARFEFDPAIHAAECPFCATLVVTDTGTDRHIKPAGLVPFQLEQAQAKDAMKRWLGSLWFAPNGLTKYVRDGGRLKGMYVPFWTFDAQTDTAYTGMRGDTYFVTQTVIRDGKPVTVQVPKIRWTPRRGRVRRFFDDVLILASPSLPKSHTDALQPWDLSGLTPYAPQYLAGFRAEAYRVELSDGLEEAKQKMREVITRDVRMDIGGDQQQITGMQTRMSDVTFKHILLPIWIAAYKYRGRSFRFVVNGQTGRVQGERPYSAWKIAFAVIAALILAGIAAFLYAGAQGGFDIGGAGGGFGVPGGDRIVVRDVGGLGPANAPSWLDD
ncbi:TFIIB-type zinc finger domain-containing protein [Jannaschia sp. LMIT008]|uniref:TFIIB-type zinc finger domain-containing protein n=1 Tax=Jannaschia maritima TaxID=3032585 RepID=UPI00281222E7|nr:TFIIB-type zinc finger domain-containing protein [Jannaschia sp. LMIT008]